MGFHKGSLFVADRASPQADCAVGLQNRGGVGGAPGQHVVDKLEVVILLTHFAKEGIRHGGVNLGFRPRLPLLRRDDAAQPLHQVGVAPGPLQNPAEDLTPLCISLRRGGRGGRTGWSHGDGRLQISLLVGGRHRGRSRISLLAHGGRRLRISLLVYFSI